MKPPSSKCYIKRDMTRVADVTGLQLDRTARNQLKQEAFLSLTKVTNNRANSANKNSVKCHIFHMKILLNSINTLGHMPERKIV